MRFKFWGVSPGDKKGKLNEAGVSDAGEQIVRAYAHSSPTIIQLTDATVTNILKPTDGMQAVITGIYASADRSIGANGEVLEIYESDAVDSGTQTKLILGPDLARQGDSGPAFPSSTVTAGQFVNADRTGTAGVITVTLWSYEVPA